MKEMLIFKFSTEMGLLALVLLFTIATYDVAYAEVKPNSLFSDNAVLQQGIEVPVWGTAKDGEKVTVEFAGQKVTTTAKDGKWVVRLKPMKASAKPRVMTITGNNTVTIANILVGEVWICSGQSNMERQLGPHPQQLPIDNWQEEVANAQYPQIRQFRVPNRISLKPIADSGGSWVVCSPNTAGNFSAVGYFFGRDLYKDIGVPIGLLFSAWGGTVAEAWTSGDSLMKMPDFKLALEDVRNIDTFEQSKNNYEKLLAEWCQKNDPGSAGRSNWADPSLNTNEWKEMNLPANWENAGLPDFDGIVWFCKEIELPESWDGKEAVLHLGPIDDRDITWVNGIKVGGRNRWNDLRDYVIPALVLKAGRNVITIRVLDTGGPGGIYGLPEQMKLEIVSDDQAAPISLAGVWRYRDSISLHEASPLPVSIEENNPNVVTVLYNGMIAPLQPFAIRGVIWYQGESNDGRAKQYQILFPLLIDDWRRSWGLGEFPFLFVQIAPYKGMSPEIREAQFLTLQKSSNTAMVVITDAGDADDIHPSHKQPVGARLALAARALAYGEHIEYSGPLFESMNIKGNRVVLHFTHAENGLMTKDADMKGFVIAGTDKKFIPARAEISGNTVEVFSDEIMSPVAVRYGWDKVPDVNLFNKEGLPATPFRTDIE